MKTDDIKSWLLAASLALPYFSRGFGALTPVLRPGFLTVAVDSRWRLYWSPEGLQKLLADGNDPVAVMQHELEHLLREHSERMGDRTAMIQQQAYKDKPPEPYPLWFICCDAEINDELVGRLGEKVWYPCKLGCKDHDTAEVYYDTIINSASGKPKEEGEGGACGGGSGVDGQERDYEAPDGEAPSVKKAESKVLVDAVANDVHRHNVKNPGTVPAGVLVWAEARMKKQTIPWKNLLKAQVRRAKAYVGGFFDYTYARANRHQGRERVLLPGNQAPEIEIDVIVDTSGSMSSEGDVVAGVLESITSSGIQRINVISCDAAVHDLKKLKSWRTVNELRGGGGTDLRVAFEKVTSPVVVVVTDGETPWPDDANGKKVIVVLCRGGGVDVPSWATTVRAV